MQRVLRSDRMVPDRCLTFRSVDDPQRGSISRLCCGAFLRLGYGLLSLHLKQYFQLSRQV